MPDPLRILVTGSPDWSDRRAVSDALVETWTRWGAGRRLVVVHDSGPGATALAADWARFMRDEKRLLVTNEPHPPGRTLDGKLARARCHARMVDLGADLCVGFVIGESPAAHHCMGLARLAGIHVICVVGRPVDDALPACGS